MHIILHTHTWYYAELTYKYRNTQNNGKCNLK